MPATNGDCVARAGPDSLLVGPGPMAMRTYLLEARTAAETGLQKVQLGHTAEVPPPRPSPSHGAQAGHRNLLQPLVPDGDSCRQPRRIHRYQ